MGFSHFDVKRFFHVGDGQIFKVGSFFYQAWLSSFAHTYLVFVLNWFLFRPCWLFDLISEHLWWHFHSFWLIYSIFLLNIRDLFTYLIILLNFFIMLLILWFFRTFILTLANIRTILLAASHNRIMKTRSFLIFLTFAISTRFHNARI